MIIIQNICVRLFFLFQILIMNPGQIYIYILKNILLLKVK